MKWILFTGTWRLVNAALERDVREAAQNVYAAGDGIVTGGATGADYFAMDEFFSLNQDASRMRIVLPSSLAHFIADYRKNWNHTPITQEHIDAVERLLHRIRAKNPQAIIEMKKKIAGDDITQNDYNARHDEEVARADAVYAFQVNNSTGTMDTIQKAGAAGLPILLHKQYTISE